MIKANQCVHCGSVAPCEHDRHDYEGEFARTAASLATPGEWYVWQDSKNETVQLLSRSHGAITPKMRNDRQTVADLTAAAVAMCYVRRIVIQAAPPTGGQHE